MSLSLLNNYGIVPSAGRKAFISTWQTANAGVSASNQVALPVEASSTFPFNVYDENNLLLKTITSNFDNIITFGSSGVKTIKVYDPINGFRFDGGGDRLKLLNISRCDILNPGNNGNFLDGCENMTWTATTSPDLTGITTFLHWFRDCKLFNPSLNSFNIANITSLFGTFELASIYNNGGIPLTWVGTNVTTMKSTFELTQFNHSIDSLITSNLLSLRATLLGNNQFNQPISGDTSNVTSIAFMAGGASSFNQDISGLNYTSVTDALLALSSSFTTANYDLLLQALKDQGFNNGGTVISATQISGVEVEFEITDHRRSIGDTFVSGNASAFTPAAYNGTFVVTSVPDANHIRCDLLSDPLGDATVIGSYGSLKSDTPIGVSAQYSSGTPASNKADIITTYSWIFTDLGETP